MAVSKKVEYLRGKVFWAKVLGNPRPNYQGDAKEWTFEFEPDADGLKIIKEHKLTDRLKDKHEDRGKYLVLKRSELTKDGEPNQPIRVYNNNDEAWDEKTLIGNGSDAVVKIDIRDYGAGKKKGVYPVALKIKELVKYQSSEFGGYDDPDAAPAEKKDTFKKDFGLEEDDLDDPLP